MRNGDRVKLKIGFFDGLWGFGHDLRLYRGCEGEVVGTEIVFHRPFILIAVSLDKGPTIQVPSRLLHRLHSWQ